MYNVSLNAITRIGNGSKVYKTSRTIESRMYGIRFLDPYIKSNFLGLRSVVHIHEPKIALVFLRKYIQHHIREGCEFANLVSRCGQSEYPGNEVVNLLDNFS